MNIVRGFFSGLFSLVLVIVLIVLGLVITINYTILNPDFVISELDKLDVHSIIMDEVKNHLAVEDPYITEIIDDIAPELEPWLKEQTVSVIYAGYAYLKEDAQLNIVIPLDEVRSSIKDYVAQMMRESPPPELEGASEAEIEFFLTLLYAEIDNRVPKQIEINEELIGTELAEQLQTVKEIIAYIKLGYKVLIGLAALLVLLIALIQWWSAKPVARFTGIAFAIAGVVSLVAVFTARFIILQIIPSNIPADIISILPRLISDSSYPLLIYGIAILATGIGLIVLSIKLRLHD